MNIHDLVELLPCGFHDAILKNITHNYENKNAAFKLEVNIDLRKNKYRDGTLIIDDVYFLIIEPPDDRYEFYDKILYIDAGPIEALKEDDRARLPLSNLPEDYFICWFFISAWNSFIFLSAKNASFCWADGEVLKR